MRVSLTAFVSLAEYISSSSGGLASFLRLYRVRKALRVYKWLQKRAATTDATPSTLELETLQLNATCQAKNTARCPQRFGIPFQAFGVDPVCRRG